MDKPNHDVDLATVLHDLKDLKEVDEGERLRLARQVLLGLGLICSGVFIAYGLEPDNTGLSSIFELVKIGALPLVTLVISFYFPNRSTK